MATLPEGLLGEPKGRDDREYVAHLVELRHMTQEPLERFEVAEP